MNDDISIHPFRIDVPQGELDDLDRRLREARWPDELPGAGWEYGVASGYLRDLADHWSKHPRSHA